MSLIYDKTEWKDDKSTPINARNLNNIEDGIEYIYHKWDKIIQDSTTGDHASELIDARYGPSDTEQHPTLGHRLNHMDSKFEDITSQLEQKVNIIDNFETENISKFTMIENYNKTINQNKSENILTVGTYNIKGFDVKDSTIIKMAQNDVYKSNCNICSIQECLKDYNFKSLDVLNTNEFNNINFTKSYNKSKGQYGLCIISNTNILSSTDYYYKSNDFEQRICQMIEINFNNKIVSIYNTHLASEGEDVVKQQLKELKTFIESDTNIYKVICGDFNTEDLSLFDDITSLGFNIANLGEHKTYKNPSKAIDNIIVSNNINILDVGMTISNNKISDHNLLYARLEVK